MPFHEGHSMMFDPYYTTKLLDNQSQQGISCYLINRLWMSDSSLKRLAPFKRVLSCKRQEINKKLKKKK